MTAQAQKVPPGRSGFLRNERRNVIIIDTDDEAWGDCGIYNLRGPMDTFRAGKITFKNNRCVEALCQPDRVLEMTGQYPQNNGIISNGTQVSQINQQNMLFRLLWGTTQERLVQVGMVGKFLSPGWEYNAGWGTAGPDWIGFDEFYGISGSNVGISNNPGGEVTAKFNWQATERVYDVNGNKTSDTLFPAGSTVTQDPTLPYSQDYIIDRLLRTIDNFTSRGVNDHRKNLPFFIFCTPNAPHDPYDLPPTTSPYAVNRAARLAAYDNWIPSWYDYNNRATMVTIGDVDQPGVYPNIDTSDSHVQGTGGLYSANPGGAVSTARNRMRTLVAVDDLLTALTNHLSSLGILDETVIIYKSDNGFFQGENGAWDDKNTFYDASLRVPLIIGGPGFDTFGSDSFAHTYNIDIMPTIANIFDIPIDYTTDNGYDIHDILTGRVDVSDRVVPLYIGAQHLGGGVTIGNIAYGAMNPRWKIWYVNNQFFDLQTDPWEQTNLSSAASTPTDPNYAFLNPPFNQMQAFRASMRVCAGDSCFQTYTYP